MDYSKIVNHDNINIFSTNIDDIRYAYVNHEFFEILAQNYTLKDDEYFLEYIDIDLAFKVSDHNDVFRLCLEDSEGFMFIDDEQIYKLENSNLKSIQMVKPEDSSNITCLNSKKSLNSLYSSCLWNIKRDSFIDDDNIYIRVYYKTNPLLKLEVVPKNEYWQD